MRRRPPPAAPAPFSPTVLQPHGPAGAAPDTIDATTRPHIYRVSLRTQYFYPPNQNNQLSCIQLKRSFPEFQRTGNNKLQKQHERVVFVQFFYMCLCKPRNKMGTVNLAELLRINFCTFNGKMYEKFKRFLSAVNGRNVYLQNFCRIRNIGFFDICYARPTAG